MLLLKLAWRNLIRHYKKSLLLGSMIMIGLAVLFLANSIFQGTTDGLKKTFIGSFTGDAVISSGSSSSFSLFGNEVPIVSDIETIPPLYTHNLILEKLKQIPEINAFTSIVSVPSNMTINYNSNHAFLFGIDPETYFDVCPDVSLIKGDISALTGSGVFLNSVIAEEMEDRLKRSLKIGEQISFTMYSGNSFRIRTVPLLGIHQYSGSTEALDLVVLADLTTARSLADYTLGFTSADDENQVIEETVDPFSLDDLFTENNDVMDMNNAGVDLQEIESNLADTEERDSLVLTDSGAWSFILLKAEEGKSRLLNRKLNKTFGDSQFDAAVLSWRQAAGGSALIFFAVQSLFYIGLGFLGLGAVLVIMNALVFSVLERTGEIGTMRSMGAAPGFIRTLFMMESLIITMSGALMGIGLGAIFARLLQVLNIQLTNSLLISLFSSTELNPLITISSVFSHLLIALILGGLAWIYPVSLAMKIQPVTAMNKG